jgi:holin-like protein
MSLLFIPAGTGVLMHLDLIRDEWLPIVAVIAVTTPLTLLITAATLRLCMPTADAKGEANRRNQP